MIAPSTRTLEDAAFQQRVSRVMEKAQQVLDSSKAPALPSEAAHAYKDKFFMVERVVNSGLEAVKNVLVAMGMETELIAEAKDWAKTGSMVTLQFEAETICTFVRTVQRKEDADTEHVVKGAKGLIFNSKNVTTITEHIWQLEHNFRLLVFRGNDEANGIVLQERTGSMQYKTSGKQKVQPFPERKLFDKVTTPIAEVLVLLGRNEHKFTIDRTHPKCFTPRRNEDSTNFVENLERISMFGRKVLNHFRNQVLRVQASSVDDSGQISSDVVDIDVVAPLIPFMKDEDSGELLGKSDVAKLLSAYNADLQAALRQVAAAVPSPDSRESKLFSSQEAVVTALAAQLGFLLAEIKGGMQLIEDMLRRQLVDAIGKEVTLDGIESYMHFLYLKTMPKGAYNPFCYDIKRHGFSPEGTLSIEAEAVPGSDRSNSSICTFSTKKEGDAAPEMSFKLSASTSVTLQGPQILHGYLAHKFSFEEVRQVNLIARARQFSTFVLLVGRISSKNTMDPKHAIILQNKDHVVIPILLKPMPSAQAFRDAIESLSPEQQEFAKAFREMQLESSVFAVAVVEVKPQLEMLLNLPGGSLTKEIKLTQDLIKLFIEFQVPSDLVTYDGEEAAPDKEKIAAVRGHANAVLDMIKAEREEELELEKKRLEDFKAQQRNIEALEDDNMLEECEEVIAPPLRPRMMRKKSGKRFSRAMKMVSHSAPMMASAAMMAPAALGGAAPEILGMNTEAQPQQLPLSASEGQQEPPHPSDKGRTASDGELDYTMVPKELDAAFESDPDGASCLPTKLQVADTWKLSRFRNLLAREPKTETLVEGDLSTKRNEAMDLLDALSRSGELPLGEAQLHVVVATTQSFDDTVMDCIVQSNENPINRIEHTADTIYTVLNKH